jgi:hypothetical protein
MTATRRADARKTERISSLCNNVGAGRASTAQGAPTVIARGNDGGYDVNNDVCAGALTGTRSLSATARKATVAIVRVRGASVKGRRKKGARGRQDAASPAPALASTSPTGTRQL